jgi:hypothetical protein
MLKPLRLKRNSLLVKADFLQYFTFEIAAKKALSANSGLFFDTLAKSESNLLVANKPHMCTKRRKQKKGMRRVMR